MNSNSLTSSESLTVDNSSATITFVKENSDNFVTEIIDYGSPLSGSDLNEIRMYTA